MRLLLWITLLAMCSAAHANGETREELIKVCSATLGLPKITVVAEPVRPIMDYSKSLADLTYRIKGRKSEDDHRITMGLVKAMQNVQVQVYSTEMDIPGTAYRCSRPDVSILIGYSDMNLYVAREFSRGSCSFANVYNHEALHVNIYHEHLNESRVALENLLRSKMGAHYFFNEDKSDLYALQSAVMKVARAQIALVDRRQQNHDSKTEYERVASGCNGETQQIINTQFIPE